MRRAADLPKFETEARMCEVFSAWARGEGWTPYAETADFDILLVHPDGTQIGIQAKLRFNMQVLRQIVPYSDWCETGPDFRAVLTPDEGESFICAALGITSFHYDRWSKRFAPGLTVRSYMGGYAGWHYWSPSKRCKLPEYVPDVAAGAPSPTRLTEWKISALEIAATLELRGFVTRHDFKLAGIDHRRWVTSWLSAGDQPGRLIASEAMPKFSVQHPEVYPKVRDKVAKRLATEIAA